MKRYCLDTSGLSNPRYEVPPDIFVTLWQRIELVIETGAIAVTKEIYDELILVPDPIAAMIRNNKTHILMEVNDDGWDWTKYIEQSTYLNARYHDYISEYNGGLKNTVGLNDMSIIALAKALGTPVVSMEVSTTTSVTKKKIPDICSAEEITHLTFNEFLRAEKISF